MTKILVVGWHHQCNERELGQNLGGGGGQGGQVCYSPWGCKEWGRTGQLNNKQQQTATALLAKGLSNCEHLGKCLQPDVNEFAFS